VFVGYVGFLLSGLHLIIQYTHCNSTVAVATQSNNAMENWDVFRTFISTRIS